MSQPTDDLRIQAITPLSSPNEVMNEYLVSNQGATTVATSRIALQKILSEQDDRLAVVIGPCSIHDPKAAIEYAKRLATQRLRLGGELEIIMRVYFEKPRTTLGWKGLINDPDLDHSFRIDKGLRMARALLRDINALGLPAGCEFLDTITPQYIADLVSWGAIGARTTESQVHRQMASGLSCPVGFKNGTEGNVKIAVDAVQAASKPHHFMALTKGGQAAIATTTGNTQCHVILRGGRQPNFDAASIETACNMIAQAGLPARVMIDVSHANSGKQPDKQPRVIENIARQIEAGEERILGVMVESNLVAGRQEFRAGAPLVFGQSITDGCIGWDHSVQVLERLAQAVRQRRMQVTKPTGAPGMETHPEFKTGADLPSIT